MVARSPALIGHWVRVKDHFLTQPHWNHWEGRCVFIRVWQEWDEYHPMSFLLLGHPLPSPSAKRKTFLGVLFISPCWQPWVGSFCSTLLSVYRTQVIHPHDIPQIPKTLGYLPLSVTRQSLPMFICFVILGDFLSLY